MPIQEGARGGQSCEPFEVLETDLLGFGGEPSALFVIKPGLFAQLFPEHSDLFLEVFDNILLVAVDPTSQANRK